MFVWRLFGDGKLRQQQSCAIKLHDLIACLSWALLF